MLRLVWLLDPDRLLEPDRLLVLCPDRLSDPVLVVERPLILFVAIARRNKRRRRELALRRLEAG